MPKLSKAFPFPIGGGAGKQNGILSNTILSNNMLAAGNALRNSVARLTARRNQPKVKLLSIDTVLLF